MTRHTIEASEKPILDIFCDKYLFRIPLCLLKRRKTPCKCSVSYAVPIPSSA
jgi:hypothetical protein